MTQRLFGTHVRTHAHVCSPICSRFFSSTATSTSPQHISCRRSRLVAYERIRWIGLDCLLLVAYGPTCIVDCTSIRGVWLWIVGGAFSLPILHFFSRWNCSSLWYDTNTHRMRFPQAVEQYAFMWNERYDFNDFIAFPLHQYSLNADGNITCAIEKRGKKYLFTYFNFN